MSCLNIFKKLIFFVVVSAFTTLLVPNAYAQRNRNVEVEGTVTDAEGKAVAGARVAQQWSYKDGQYTPAGKSLLTDEKGHFKGELSLFREWSGLLVVDTNNKIGDVELLNDEQLKQPLAFKLEPLVPVEFSVVAKELPGFQEQDGIELFVAKEGGDGAANEPQAYLLDLNIEKQPLRVPAGAFRLLVRSNNIRYFQHRFSVASNSAPLNLGVLEAPASKLGQLFGKPAPDWTAQAVRGIPPVTKISDYRGKWLVVEFWAHWCVPCVNGGIPRLKAFYERHQADRDKFEAIAIHDSSLKSFDEVDARTAEVKQRAWGNKDLPFPVIIDKEKHTFSDWGIGAIPNVLLVSPDGTLIRTDEPLGYLESQLKRTP